MRLVEWAAVKDADQLLSNGLLVGFAPGIERNCRHVPNSKRAEKVPPPTISGCSFIPLHTRTSGHALSFPLWVISRHTDMIAACPLYPQERTLGGTSKSAFGCRFMSTRPNPVSNDSSTDATRNNRA